MKCELCNRSILPVDESTHHLVPKSRGGVNGSTAILHGVCHRQIHALFSEQELALLYNDIKSLKEHRDVKRFIRWVGKKDPGFTVKTRIKRKRR